MIKKILGKYILTLPSCSTLSLTCDSIRLICTKKEGKRASFIKIGKPKLKTKTSKIPF
jgi:hypothetical protein